MTAAPKPKPKPKPPPLPRLFHLAALVKTAAVEEHAARRGARASRATKADGSWVTELDSRIQKRVRAELRRAWPQYDFIGEEMTHAEQREVCARGGGYWVLDPLDGTTNFAAGFQFYAISLALVSGGAAQLGVVFDPVRGECFCAQAGRGAYLNRRRLQPPPPRKLGECIAIVDHKYLLGDLSVRLVRSPPYRSQRNLGAAALEWCWLAADRAQLYLHGGQKLWDFAAGYLILAEAGGAATSLSGKPLDCARLRKRSALAATDSALLRNWETWVQANRGTVQVSPL